jgi:hypothetical protein
MVVQILKYGPSGIVAFFFNFIPLMVRQLCLQWIAKEAQ